MGHCDSWAIPYHEGEIDSRCSRCQGSLYPNSVWQRNIYFEYIQRWWGECVFHMIWLNQPFSKSRPTARVFLPFLRNRQITKEAFQFLESNRKLVKGHVLSYLWKDVRSFQHFLFQTHYTSPSKFLFHDNSKQIPAHTPALHNEESRGYTCWGKEHCCICILLFKSLESIRFSIKKLTKKCHAHNFCILFGKKCIQINFVKLLHHKRAVFATVITHPVITVQYYYYTIMKPNPILIYFTL